MNDFFDVNAELFLYTILLIIVIWFELKDSIEFLFTLTSQIFVVFTISLFRTEPYASFRFNTRINPAAL